MAYTFHSRDGAVPPNENNNQGVAASQRVGASQRVVPPSQSVAASQRVGAASQRVPPSQSVPASQRVGGAASQRVGASQRAPPSQSVPASQRMAPSMRASQTTRQGGGGFRASQMAGRGIPEEPGNLEGVDAAAYEPASSFAQSAAYTGGGGGVAPTWHSVPGPIQEEEGQSQQYQASQRQEYAQSKREAPPPEYQASQNQRPQTGRSIVIRPGEPHHFGMRSEQATASLICTLCRCKTPMAHGNAYTMLRSPRGFGIDGQPIDWQTGKNRMLDYHGADQISHEQEIAAIPHVFDANTAALMLANEESLRQSVVEGKGVAINTTGNQVNWHTETGTGKEDITEQGLRTRRF